MLFTVNFGWRRVRERESDAGGEVVACEDGVSEEIWRVRDNGIDVDRCVRALYRLVF